MLRFMGSQRVGHNCVTELNSLSLCVYIYIYIYIHTHICIPFLNYSFPLCFIIGYCIWVSLLYSKTLLFIHSIYKSLYLLTPTSHSIPPLTLSPLATTSLFSMSMTLFFLKRMAFPASWESWHRALGTSEWGGS